MLFPLLLHMMDAPHDCWSDKETAYGSFIVVSNVVLTGLPQNYHIITLALYRVNVGKPQYRSLGLLPIQPVMISSHKENNAMLILISNSGLLAQDTYRNSSAVKMMTYLTHSE